MNPAIRIRATRLFDPAAITYILFEVRKRFPFVSTK